ncbi:MAG TPA: ammonia-forming cytochrome c nitrite reductase subunit c552 [Candidatus Polarisedimenticolia bacterium]|nr:ammonia-forming cytochrome c nitrite reductase subunit c552 [Candidatus Polarisedimenticolia bacterium]
MKSKFFLGTILLILLLSAAAPARAQNQACSGCHAQKVAEVAASSHGGLPCQTCHEGALDHAVDITRKPRVHFDLEVCAACHPDEYGTYIYGDNWKTTYGGSPNLWSKLNDFAYYNDIIDGYGFTREYNEERSHNVMLQDHHDITRGKYETCLQCKSTKVAYYWDTGQERVVENETLVRAGHMAGSITVPAGTRVTMMTDRLAPYPLTHEVRVLVTLPDGTLYASFDYPGAGRNPQWLWAALYALTVNELPPGSPTRLSGNGCNHCHDPHTVDRDAATGKLTGFRIIRKSLIDAIARKGINPYDPTSPKTFDGSSPLSLDEGIALCAQCHVEYVCGNSPIDGIDRDYFSWAKAADLESVYQAVFPGYGLYGGMKYIQDWTHGAGPLGSANAPGNNVFYSAPHPIGEALIKSQHPEAETYWGSRHYGNGAECFVCHMPKVTRAGDGTQFTSHWMASPIKYMTPGPVTAFAASFNLQVDSEGMIPPCAACHGGRLSRMKDKAERIQDDVYIQALTVQDLLVASLAGIKAAKDSIAQGQPVDPVLLQEAVEDHRAAHVRWENLIVSENSMGFHNPAEVTGNLTEAQALAQSALQRSTSAQPASRFPVPVPPTIAVVPSGPVPGELVLSYDIASCNAADHMLVIGSLGDFRTATSAVCSIGSSGSFTIASSPDNVWFLIAGVEDATYSSLGQSTSGERIVNGIASVCPALTAQELTGICP